MRFQDRRLLIKFVWINASTEGVLAEIANEEERDDRDDCDDREDIWDYGFEVLLANLEEEERQQQLLDFFHPSSPPEHKLGGNQLVFSCN
jgi:hypothetical protein